MAEEMTMGEISRNLEKLTKEISGYMKSNEERMRAVENTVAELRIINKNFMWIFGIAITITGIISNIIIKSL